MFSTYRLVQTTYRQRVEYEDGPGSLQNIVSDESRRVLYVWENKDENFAERLLKDGLSGLPRDTPDGRIDYSHMLERRSTGDTGEWRYVGSVEPRSREDEYDEGEY